MFKKQKSPTNGKIGVFVDISKTLTKKAVLAYYAHQFGFETFFNEIDQGYANGDINSEQFADKLGEAFANAKVKKKDVSGLADGVALRDGVSDFLKFCKAEDIDIFLVSATPDFFVEEFADKYQIPPEHCLSARAEFDAEDKLAKIEGVSPGKKSSFVSDNAPAYKLSIGIGDNDYHDGPFISKCDVKFIVVQPGDHVVGDESFLYAISIQTIKEFIRERANEYLKSHSLLNHFKIWLSKQVRENFVGTVLAPGIAALIFFIAAVLTIYDIIDRHLDLNLNTEITGSTSSSD